MLGKAISQAGEQAWNANNQLQKERQAAQDQMVVAKNLMEQQRQLEQFTIQHDESFAQFDGPIEERINVYNDGAKNITKSLVDSIPAGSARDKFSLESAQLETQYAVRQMKVADHNRYVLAHKTTVTELDKTANEIAAFGDNLSLSFEDKKSLIEQKLALADKLITGPHLTAEDSANLAKAKPEMMAKAFAATALLKNPAELVQMLDSGAFGKELDPSVKNSLKDEALKALPAFKEKAELMAALGDGKTFSGVLSKIASGDESGAAVELANLPDSKAVRAFRAQLYKTKINEPSNPYEEGRLNDRFEQLEYDKKTKTAKANALDMIEYMVDLSETRTSGGIDQKSFNSKLKQVVTPFLAEVGDQKPALANVHATGWQSVKRFFGMDKVDPKGKTPEAVEVYNDFATILGEQPKITSETVTSSLRQALGNYARKNNPELAFMAEIPDGFMRPNGVPEKVGVGSEKKADVTEKSEPLVRVRNPKTGKTKDVLASQAAKLIAAGAEQVNG